LARIHVTRRLPFPALARLEAAGHVVDVWPGELPPDPGELRLRAAATEGLLCLLTDRIDADLLESARLLRVVSNFAVGTDNVDLDACRARGIAVGRTPDVLTDATADLAFALLLAVARRLPEAVAAARGGEWRTFEAARWLGTEFSGATLLIVGPGRIGRAVARRAEGFGLRVLTAGRGDDLHGLLAQADFVSLHCPLTPETRHLIDAAALRAMQPTAYLVNTARGPVVDQAALIAALHDGTIAGAALDVTDPEPPPPGDPIFEAPNLLLVPHIGSATTHARARMAEMAVDNLLAGLAGEPLPHPA
jgi:glyoxylate reductase